MLSAAAPILDASGPCALGSDHAVRCAGDQGKPLRVVWTHARRIAMAMGSSFGCAVLEGGAVSCSGLPFGERVSTVGGLPPIRQVAVTTTRACALAEDGAVYCWSHATGEVARVPLAKRAIAIGMSESHTCVLGEDAELACF